MIKINSQPNRELTSVQIRARYSVASEARAVRAEIDREITSLKIKPNNVLIHEVNSGRDAIGFFADYRADLIN